MADEVLVTGATGFIGRVLTARLRAAGCGVRCLVRDPVRAARLGLPQEVLRPGSLDDSASLRAAARGAATVVHLAGATRAFGQAGYDATNVAGTAHLLAALRDVAPDAGLVQVSSLAAAGPSVDGATANLDPGSCRPVSAYGRSKLGGEVEVARERAARGLRAVVIRPPVVYGAADEATALLFDQALAPLAVVPWRARPLSVIHVEDLVAFLHAAVVRLAAVDGRHLSVEGPERLDTDELPRRIAQACGRRARLLRIPMALPRYLVAPLVEGFARLRRRPGFLSVDKMREASAVGWVADGGPAIEALGHRPEVAVDAGLRAVALTEGRS